jgi:TolA-binding protein
MELFARGDWTRAAAAFEADASEGSAAEQAEARFFLALTMLARQDDASALQTLRRLQEEHPDSPWARAAGVLDRSVAHGMLLREEWVRAVVNLDKATDRLRTLEQQVGVLEAQQRPDQAALAASREERTRLQGQIKQSEERLATLTERIVELERELGELKQVDLQRAP